MVPFLARIALVRGVRKRFISFVNPCGSCLNDSEMGGEAADIAEHDGHLALLAAEHEFLRRLGELFYQRGRQIRLNAERICRRCACSLTKLEKISVR